MVRVILLLALVLWPIRLSLADDAAPYDAYVTSDRAPVRSGPGDQWYATSALAKGARIKVYHRTTDGWLAVRPTATDFCWVEVSHVTHRTTGVGAIANDKAVSWIGVASSLPGDHKWQVRLERGASVELLAKSRVKLLAGHPAVMCWKIAPPSGEFRWIAESHTRQPSLSASAVQLASHQIPVVVPAAAAEKSKWRSPSQRRAQSHQIPQPSAQTFVAAPRELDDNGVPQVSPIPVRADANARSVPPVGTSKPLPDLVQLRLKLSEMVVRPAEDWQLDGLREQAVAIVQEHTDPVERGRARLLLERIDDFRFMQHRRRLTLKAVTPAASNASLANATVKEPVVHRNKVPAADDGLKARLQALTKLVGEATLVEPQPAVGTAVEPASRRRPKATFPAQGWLVEVRSPNRRLPRYALLNRQGKVVHFLTPHPGLNIRRYLKREIGVFGTSGKHSLVHEPHIVAHRVVDLARHKKR